MIASRFSFAAIFAYRVWLRRWWYRLTSSGMAHQPVEVRTRPQHDVIIRYVFAVIAFAGTLSEPLAYLARFDAHRFLPARHVTNAFRASSRSMPCVSMGAEVSSMRP